MNKRPINLPELPPSPYRGGQTGGLFSADELESYARAAVEADRAGIVVYPQDVHTAELAASAAEHVDEGMLRALQSFAKRLRGEG